MWISRGRYRDLLAQVQESEENARSTVAAIRGDVARALEEAEQLNRERDARTAADITKAEARALAAELALTVERAENRKSEQHWASMFLRREKSFPLPPTAKEKEEVAAEAEEAKNRPPILTDVQISMRDANRIEAARHGISEEDADKDFAKYMAEMMTE